MIGLYILSDHKGLMLGSHLHFISNNDANIIFFMLHVVILCNMLMYCLYCNYDCILICLALVMNNNIHSSSVHYFPSDRHFEPLLEPVIRATSLTTYSIKTLFD